LSEWEEEQLYNVIPKLWPIREVAPEEVYLFKKIDYGMLQPKDKVDYRVYFYEHQLRKTLILDEVVDITIKD
jgi:hypothetical protein